LNLIAGRVPILKINDTDDRKIAVRGLEVKFNGDRPSIGVIKHEISQLHPNDVTRRLELYDDLNKH